MKKAPQHVGDRRLLRLATFLEELPPRRFDYRTMVGPDWGGAQDLSCGTTACAIGWAATMPQFRKFGLRIVGQRHGYVSGGAVRDGYTGTAIFSLTDAEWDFLFQPGLGLYYEDTPKPGFAKPHYTATAKEVAKHIRRFVAWRKEQRAR